jgi:hypothetical protein
MGTTSTERSQALRAKRNAKNLKQKTFWVHAEDEKVAKEVIRIFEERALRNLTNERNKLSLERMPQVLKDWKDWLEENPKKEQTISNNKQRLEAYRISRAVNIPFPDDVTFSDYHLLQVWIDEKKKSFNTGIVKDFISNLEE